MPSRLTTICEHCGRASPDLTHNREADEYWCDGCFDEKWDEARSIIPDPPA